MRESSRSHLQKHHRDERTKKWEQDYKQERGERSRAGTETMETRRATCRSAALLLLAAILASAASASSIGDKCAACKAVAVSSRILFFLSFLPLSSVHTRTIHSSFGASWSNLVRIKIVLYQDGKKLAFHIFHSLWRRSRRTVLDLQTFPRTL